jgi:hypothetical protein
MSCFSNLTAERSQRWHSLLVLLVIGSLTISVTTRYSASGAASGSLSVGALGAIAPHAIAQSIVARSITLGKQSSAEPGRQRLLKNAAIWNPPADGAVLLLAPSFYSRVAPSEPSVATPRLAGSLYNRPPPSC